ncbi:Uncharacterised protein [Mycobacteroides abscessus subsp. abscessus]|nr:Uncharacterised protein [Mycobacteroides abscessus subsp. abscessus]
MHRSAFEYPRNNFRVAVRVRVKAFARVDCVLIVDHQKAMGIPGQIEIACHGERLPRLKPFIPPVPPIGGSNYTNGGHVLGHGTFLPLRKAGARRSRPRCSVAACR